MCIRDSDKAVLAEEAFPAEGFHVDRDPVPRLYLCDAASCFLHDPHQLMAHGDAGNSPGNGAVLDVKITGADACLLYTSLDGINHHLSNAWHCKNGFCQHSTAKKLSLIHI